MCGYVRWSPKEAVCALALEDIGLIGALWDEQDGLSRAITPGKLDLNLWACKGAHRRTWSVDGEDSEQVQCARRSRTDD